MPTCILPMAQPEAGWLPIAGDWNGDGKDTIGLYDPTKAVFYLRNTNDAGYADVSFAYGAARGRLVADCRRLE